jgi:hypothetical protein
MFLCMRTTLESNEELFRPANKHVADGGPPLRAVVEAAVRGKRY